MLMVSEVELLKLLSLTTKLTNKILLSSQTVMSQKFSALTYRKKKT